MKTFKHRFATNSYVIECPACTARQQDRDIPSKWPQFHVMVIQNTLQSKIENSFNGNFDHPTFNSPVDYYYGDMDSPDDGEIRPANKKAPRYRCHFLITDGKIQYMDNCTHGLKGKTVELPDIDKNIVGLNT